MEKTCDTKPNAVLKSTDMLFFRIECGMQGKIHKEYEGCSEQPHEMEAQFWMARSTFWVGKDCFGVVRKRRLEHQKKQVPVGRGHEGFLTLSMLSVNTRSRTGQCLENAYNQTKRGKSRGY